MFKILMFVTLAAGSATVGQHLITATQSLMAGEMKLANINPYSSAQAQDAQIGAGMAQVNQARAVVQQAP